MSEVEPSKVLYFDFELSLEQFGYRYSDKKDKTKHHIFQDNFIRVSMKKYVRAKPSDVIQAIREKVEEHNPKLIVIDNITKIGRKLEESEKAQELLEDLLAIKMEFDTAILILAHIRKRNDEEIITDDDLFGSSFQGNFFDSMFAVGQSICNPDLRYLKQIAVRTGETIYNTENVLVCRITKDNCFLRFTLDDSLNQTESEFTLLKKRTGKENDKLDRDIMEAYRQNPDKKFGEIARELKTNFNRVKRTLKRNGLTEND